MKLKIELTDEEVEKIKMYLQKDVRVRVYTERGYTQDLCIEKDKFEIRV